MNKHELDLDKRVGPAKWICYGGDKVKKASGLSVFDMIYKKVFNKCNASVSIKNIFKFPRN